MSEQATMTQEQLEAAGYQFYILAHTTLWCAAIDGWQRPSVSIETALIAATAHYRQQQELFNFREFLHDIDGLLDKLAFYNSNHDALDDLQILRASINIPNTWHGDAGTWNPPTVSKSERAE